MKGYVDIADGAWNDDVVVHHSGAPVKSTILIYQIK